MSAMLPMLPIMPGALVVMPGSQNGFGVGAFSVRSLYVPGGHVGVGAGEGAGVGELVGMARHAESKNPTVVLR